MISWANSGAADNMLNRIHSLPESGEVPKALIRNGTSVTANCSRKPTTHATIISLFSK